ncbi:hypothetical protein [Corynebacterium camporealensis]|uniref:hypothetical protein n=1 Tax=Corynebacterium camporealensis TaxID=161896 RepID=UPI00062381EC|nr:hypothetical protein [Corynebacterium camporealensis]
MQRLGFAALLTATFAVVGCSAEAGVRNASEEASLEQRDGEGASDGTSATGSQGEAANPDGGVVDGHPGGLEDDNSNEQNDAGGGASGGLATASDEGYGVLPPLGPFDPTAPDFELFDPCTEIPQEVFDELNLERVEEGLDLESVKNCTFSMTDGPFVMGLSGLAVDLETVAAQAIGDRIILDDAVTPHSMFHQIDPEKGFHCAMHTETSRGTLMLSIGSFSEKIEGAAVCLMADKYMQDLV